MASDLATDQPKAKKPKRHPWRYYNILLHRYLGYFFLGITLVYAISGLAVNHIEGWNPNFSIAHQTTQIAPLADPENISDAEVKKILKQFPVQGTYNPDNVFYPDDQTIEILLSSNEKILVQLDNQQAKYELITRRPLLHLFNFLHLNNAKKAWTLYADIYAIALIFLACTGLLMKKGKKGVWGEAGIWTLAGMVVPAVLVLLYYQ